MPVQDNEVQEQGDGPVDNVSDPPVKNDDFPWEGPLKIGPRLQADWYSLRCSYCLIRYWVLLEKMMHHGGVLECPNSFEKSWCSHVESFQYLTEEGPAREENLWWSSWSKLLINEYGPIWRPLICRLLSSKRLLVHLLECLSICQLTCNEQVINMKSNANLFSINNFY